MVGRIIRVVLEGRDGGSENVNAFCMRFAYDLLIHFDDSLCRLDSIGASSQVVDRLKEDNPLHSFLAEQVALIAVDCRRTKSSSEHTVSADTHIEHRHMAGLWILQQPAGEHVGPSVLLIGGGPTSVSDGVAEYGYRPGLLVGHDLKRQDVVPVLRLDGIDEI